MFAKPSAGRNCVHGGCVRCSWLPHHISIKHARIAPPAPPYSAAVFWNAAKSKGNCASISRVSLAARLIATVASLCSMLTSVSPSLLLAITAAMPVNASCTSRSSSSSSARPSNCVIVPTASAMSTSSSSASSANFPITLLDGCSLPFLACASFMLSFAIRLAIFVAQSHARCFLGAVGCSKMPPSPKMPRRFDNVRAFSWPVFQ